MLQQKKKESKNRKKIAHTKKTVKEAKVQFEMRPEKVLYYSGLFIVLIAVAFKAFQYFDEKINTETFGILHNDRPVLSTTKQYEEEKLSAPVKISIPTRGITEVPVLHGGVVSGEWVLSGDGAYFVVTSGLPGEGYNTIIYAHNTKTLFGELKNIVIGDNIEITNEDGKIFTYEVYSIENIVPSSVDALKTTKTDVLTLFTCDGRFDRERRVVRGKLRAGAN